MNRPRHYPNRTCEGYGPPPIVLSELTAYAKDLGGTYHVHTLPDGGRRVTVTMPDGSLWSKSYEWGDEPRFFADLQRWLNEQPWPSEDDPRVAQEYPCE